MSSTRYSPWERATRSQATAMAAALATQQMQQNQLAEFGGRVRHWERIPVVVCGQRGFGPDGSEKTLGGFKITKWSATDTSIPQEQCVPKKGIEPVRKTERSNILFNFGLSFFLLTLSKGCNRNKILTFRFTFLGFIFPS